MVEEETSEHQKQLQQGEPAILGIKVPFNRPARYGRKLLAICSLRVGGPTRSGSR